MTNNIVSIVELSNGRVGYSVRDRVNPKLTGKIFDLYGHESTERAVGLITAAQRKSIYEADPIVLGQVLNNLKVFNLNEEVCDDCMDGPPDEPWLCSKHR